SAAAAAAARRAAVRTAKATACAAPGPRSRRRSSAGKRPRPLRAPSRDTQRSRHPRATAGAYVFTRGAAAAGVSARAGGQVSASRWRVEVLHRPDRDDPVRVDRRMAAVIVLLDVVEVDRAGDAGPLVQL